MRSLAILLLLGSILLSGTNADAALAEDRTLSFGCSDTVVIGKVRNTSFSPIANEKDILGDGLVSATISVRKVVRGGKLPSVVSAGYVAHTYMREDREFMLVLHKADDGTFSIVTGQLMSARPKLASRCE